MAEPPPPPSAPWTAPPAPAPAFRPPKRRRARVWIYLLVGAVVVIVGLAVASGTVWIQKIKPPIDAANDYLRDISRGNYEAAFDQLCAQEQVDGSARSLERTVEELVVFGLDDYEVSPFEVHIDGSRATVEADLDADSFRRTDADVVRIRVEEIDGEWRPCGGRFGFVASSRRPDPSSQAKLLDRGYTSSGSVMTFTSDGPGVVKARSSAGPISPGSPTSSPWPPSAVITSS